MSTDRDDAPAASTARPDYELEERRVVSDATTVTAMFDPLRGTLLDLVLERAATVKELAVAVDRPPSSIAYHVNVLVAADLLRVVRTRKVRAVDERFYGRTARTFVVGRVDADGFVPAENPLADAAAESTRAFLDDDLRAIRRHARIPDERAHEFWSRVLDLVDEFSALPRAGGTTFALAAGLYPTEFPTLPPADPTAE